MQFPEKRPCGMTTSVRTIHISATLRAPCSQLMAQWPVCLWIPLLWNLPPDRWTDIQQVFLRWCGLLINPEVMTEKHIYGSALFLQRMSSPQKTPSRQQGWHFNEGRLWQRGRRGRKSDNEYLFDALKKDLLKLLFHAFKSICGFLFCFELYLQQ